MMKVQPIFLLGSDASFLREDGLGYEEIADRAEQETRAKRILESLGTATQEPVLVREDPDLSGLDISADVFVVFAHAMARFPSLMVLAATGLPVIVTSEEGALGNILDVLEYLPDCGNVTAALTPEEVRGAVESVEASRRTGSIEVCVFDRGKRSLEMAPWLVNSLFSSVNIHYVSDVTLDEACAAVDGAEAGRVARKWVKAAGDTEVPLEDVMKSARVYIAMRTIIEDVHADAAYVLWCGQFSKTLGTKMCLAIANLNDDGYLTGCWRGGNLLPMIILHRLSRKPVFFGEVHTYLEGVLSIRHCAVPGGLSPSPFRLRRWRDQPGTVTAYCELPEGEVTIAGAGRRGVVALKGRVIDCRDLGGANCRTTVWVAVDDESRIRRMTGREVAMCYGDYVDAARRPC
jgi:hypothetical protein